MAAAPPAAVQDTPQQVISSDSSSPGSSGDDTILSILPTTKVYKLTKDLTSRKIVCEKALTVEYPEFFHTLNLENFDIATLGALFYDVQPGDNFLHFLQGARLSFRLTRGPKDLPLPNIGAILGRMRLFTVLSKAGVTFSPNEKLLVENCDWDYDDLPVSLPASLSMFDDIKEDYLQKYPNEDFADSVIEFSTSKRTAGIWLKYVKPVATTAALPAPTSMVVDSTAAAIPKGKRPRSASEVVPVVITTVVSPPPAAAAPQVPAGKKRPTPLPPKANA